MGVGVYRLCFRRYTAVLYALDIFMYVCDIPLPRVTVVGVGSSTYTYIWGVVPIAAVVYSLTSWFCEVAYLIVLVPCL